MTDRAHRKQVVEGEGEITGRHEQRGKRNLPRLGALDGFEHLVGIDAPKHVVEHVARDPDHRDADHNTQLVQDLLLAQKRDRPAYCFQHLDLEWRSRDHGYRANPAYAPLFPALSGSAFWAGVEFA